MQCKWVLVVIFVIFLRLYISAQHFALYVTFLKCYQQLILLANYCILRFAVSQTCSTYISAHISATNISYFRNHFFSKSSFKQYQLHIKQFGSRSVTVGPDLGPNSLRSLSDRTKELNTSTGIPYTVYFSKGLV